MLCIANSRAVYREIGPIVDSSFRQSITMKYNRACLLGKKQRCDWLLIEKGQRSRAFMQH